VVGAGQSQACRLEGAVTLSCLMQSKAPIIKISLIIHTLLTSQITHCLLGVAQHLFSVHTPVFYQSKFQQSSKIQQGFKARGLSTGQQGIQLRCTVNDIKLTAKAWLRQTASLSPGIKRESSHKSTSKHTNTQGLKDEVEVVLLLGR